MKGLLLCGPLLITTKVAPAPQGPIRVSKADIIQATRDAASRHGLNVDLYLKIVTIESSLRPGAYNARTKDIGLSQVNLKTAKAFGFNVKRLKQDYKYNLNAGAIILADFKRRYKARNPDLWPCRYNVGSGRLQGPKLEACRRYMSRLEAVQL